MVLCRRKTDCCQAGRQAGRHMAVLVIEHKMKGKLLKGQERGHLGSKSFGSRS